jgi:hypothetical protein
MARALAIDRAFARWTATGHAVDDGRLLYAGRSRSHHSTRQIPVAVSERHFSKRFQGKDTCAIDKDIAVAEASADLSGKRVDRAFRGDIAFPSEHIPPGLFDKPDGISCGKNVGNDDVSPILCKAMRECLPDIITGLDAADELGEAAIQIVAGNVQAAVGPSPAEVGAHIKPGPIVGRRYDWRLLTGALVGQVRCTRADTPVRASFPLLFGYLKVR